MKTKLASKSTIMVQNTNQPYIDLMDHAGETALMKAAALGRLSTCKLLVQFGASIPMENSEGKTATLLAKMGANFDVASYLLQNNNNISVIEKENELALLSQRCFRKLYVVKRHIFLGFVRLMDFEAAEKQGYVILYPGMGKILFISHRWLGGLLSPAHPDNPENIKNNAIKNAVTEHSDFADVEYIWIDFTCVPQHNNVEQQLAINSLPYIVKQCSYFVVLTGKSDVLDIQGKDEASLEVYTSRGWCRLECISARLAQNLKCWVCNINTGTVTVLDTLGSVEDLNPFQGNFFEMEDRRKIAPMVFALCFDLESSKIKVDAYEHLRLDAQQRAHDDQNSGCADFPVAEMTRLDLVREHIKIARSFV